MTRNSWRDWDWEICRAGDVSDICATVDVVGDQRLDFALATIALIIMCVVLHISFGKTGAATFPGTHHERVYDYGIPREKIQRPSRLTYFPSQALSPTASAPQTIDPLYAHTRPNPRCFLSRNFSRIDQICRGQGQLEQGVRLAIPSTTFDTYITPSALFGRTCTQTWHSGDKGRGRGDIHREGDVPGIYLCSGRQAASVL
ncbi:hypothetical protein NEOLEDRAFT_887454 [Neolentinus lepideus HHB14362 ss-1]|uniref:Uncharacterized protein n=1 Tax=Neolentinus lepideus HHB14362 ss-1 TaxID=1314782 RepID=A0A165NX89_9AGAM|nr:hypothetical protein NEOLEDRAFT_887454 [Neolentinus lepideus HHB14362 ss-1]